MFHLTNGSATAAVLELSDIPGDIGTFADALHEGPLTLGPADELRALRATYLARVGGTAELAAQESLAQHHAHATQAFAADETVLWYEHDTFDQFALMYVLATYAWPLGHRTVSMVSIDRHPDLPNFLGLGQLSSEQLAALWPARTPVGKDAVEEATAAWIAVAASDPRAVPFVAKRTRALPFLAAALERWLEEFPDAQSGLGRNERQVLAAVARGLQSEAALLEGLHAIDPRASITDSSLRMVVEGLHTAGLLAGQLHEHTIEITAVGRRALAGTYDRVAETGIDKWHGGTRLLGHRDVWRWEPSERRLLRK